ncbi:hypothetical protein CFP56_043914 [Quercus suber]|uniref:Leucine-rich repeat domain, L domain-containing protein n=1 Tax=Quercus suber TaxID=58331 RepID=A0AAW0IR37_QUESU
MKCLEVLELSRSGIRGLPSSIRYLIALRTLYLYDCPNLSDPPDIIYKFQLPEESVFPTTPSILTSNSPNCSFGYGFSRLEALNIINCENITKLEFFLKLEFLTVLKYLYLSLTNIVTIPKHISSFTILVLLEIISCKKLQEIRRLPQSIRRVCAKNWSLDPLSSNWRNYRVNKECEGARGDTLMDIGQSTRFSHQYRELRFQVGSTSTIKVSKIQYRSGLAAKFQKLPSVLLLDWRRHIEVDFIIRFTFPSMEQLNNSNSSKQNHIVVTCETHHWISTPYSPKVICVTILKSKRSRRGTDAARVKVLSI